MITDLSENIIKLITNFYNRDFPKVKITTENGEVNATLAGILDKELIILNEETVVTMIPWNKIEILEASRMWCKKSGFVTKSVKTFTTRKVNQYHRREKGTQR